MKRAAKVIAIVDSSKIEKSSSAVLAKLNQIDKLITDKPVSEDFSKKLEAYNIEIVVAD